MIQLGLLDFFLGKDKKPQKSDNIQSYLWGLSGYAPVFSTYDGELYEIGLVKAIVNRIATECSKASPVLLKKNKELDFILTKKPNQWQTPSQFFNRLATIYFLENNAYIIPIRDEYGTLTGIYPLSPQMTEIKTYKGEAYIVFTVASGEKISYKYRDVGHLKRMNYKNDYFGDDNNAFSTTAELLMAQEEGSRDAIRSSSTVRFMGQISSNIIDDEDFREQQDAVSRLNLKDNDSGVFLYDARFKDMKPIENKPLLLDANQKKAIENSAFNYWGVCEDFLQNNYKEDTWNSTYESQIEPFFIQSGEALSKVFYSDNQLKNGNGVMIASDRLQYASNKTKMEVAFGGFDRGMFTLDKVLTILNSEPIGGTEGSRRYIRLEYADITNGRKGVDGNDDGKTNNESTDDANGEE